MTPDPPPSSDGSALPPRHRPNMGNLAKDSTEIDLWSFDDPDPALPEALPAADAAAAAAPPKVLEPLIPAPRFKDKTRQLKSVEDAVPPVRQLGKQDSIRTNIGAKRNNLPSGLPSTQMPAISEFGELDHWDEQEVTPPAASLPVLAPVAPMPVPRDAVTPEVPTTLAEMPGPLTPHSEPSIAVREELPEAAPSTVFEEALPVVSANRPAVSLRPRLQLSKFEAIGLSVFVGAVVVGGALAYFNTIHRLPDVVENVKPNDFPIVGKHVTLESAASYWREPVAEGPNADTFRRDTVLLPEVVFTATGKTGAIRLFFRDGDGKGVGDAVTRAVHEGEKIRITATAGFEDTGMHASYRLSEGKRWTIEVMEAPSEQSSTFEKLFTMNVSEDRH